MVRMPIFKFCLFYLKKKKEKKKMKRRAGFGLLDVSWPILDGGVLACVCVSVDC